MLCGHTRQAWLPCAHSDCPQGSSAPTITRILGRAGARREVTFTASPTGPMGRPRWTWVATEISFFLEVHLGGGRVPAADELVRAALGIA